MAVANVTVGGHRIAYDVTGTGPVAVLQHGLFSRRATWHENGFVAALARDYTVVALDSLGHGESDRPADRHAYARDARADQLAAVLDAVGAERAHVVGYSMGGWLATGFAARHPERLLSVAIGGWDPVGGRPPAARAIPVETVLAGARARAPQLLAWIDSAALPGLRACWDALGELDGATSALAECGVPVLLFAGRADPAFAAAEAAAARIAGARFAAVGGDHLGAMTAHAAESLDAVREHLARSTR
jgi:pimeloyl-ACP methyl ester carboxylesterase